MRFLFLPFLASAGLGFASPCLADPSSLLAPDDPSYSSGWRAPASPTAGLKAFSPAQTKDWLQMNRNVTPSGSSKGGMSDMGSMDMKGMDKKSAPENGADKKGGSMEGMPGMSGMPGMGKIK